MASEMIRLAGSVAWIACVAYATIPLFWLLIHPRAAYWRSRLRSPYRVLLPLWIAMGIVLGVATSPWRSIALYHTAWSWLPSAALLAAGMAIYALGGAGFSARQLAGLPEVLPAGQVQQLVTSGIRARVRHPIYLAHLLEMLAWSVGAGLLVCYVLTGFAILTGAFMIALEDQELERRFGEAYRQYRRKVPAALPRI
jgi:protein-S-isoprenylcysteine O-methyltransferase Ste14